MREEEIKLTKDISERSPKGTIFVRGDLSHGIPDYYKNKSFEPKDWYWKKDTKKEDNEFLSANLLV